jgi:hypothetical protein
MRPLSSTFEERTAGETRAWHHRLDHKLPSYYACCTLELAEMKNALTNGLGVENESWLITLCTFPLLLLIASGLAHLLTRVGRTVLYIIGHKMVTFLRLCLGIWYEADVIAFGIHKKVFDSSPAWCNPNLLLKLEKSGLIDKYHQMRRSEQASIPYEDIKALTPHDAPEMESLQQDYALTLHSVIAMRACLVQAIPYMSLLSIFASFVCAYPIVVKSESLKACLFQNWVQNASQEARETIEERIRTNAAIRDAEMDEHASDLPNPDFDSDGAVVPESRRKLIEKVNKARQEPCCWPGRRPPKADGQQGDVLLIINN